MADFRRWFTVLAVLAVMAMAASAQVGVATGSANSLLACNATAAGTPELRPEGYTELVGDIVITCTGGPVYAQGSLIPTTNIVVYMQPATPITSRFLSSNGASEALLIIDEAGSTSLPTGAVGQYGPAAPQTLCSYTQEINNSGPNQGSSCTAYVGVDQSGKYEVAVAGPSGLAFTTNAQNVYQGKVGDFGANSVTFYNVPVLPPATSGVTRTFRITNIRVAATSQFLSAGVGGFGGGSVGAFISTSPSTVLPVTFQTINVGVVGPYMNASVAANKTAFTQCVPLKTPTLSATISFTEGFATSFKTRVVPGGAANITPGGNPNFAWAAEGTNTAAPNNQNIPGGLYGGLAANSESGFIYPLLTGTSGGATYTAGLADFGTRLKAVFTNIPAGLTLYVSTTSTGSSGATPPIPNPPGGTSALPFAVLVATNTGEATSDGTGFGASSAGTPLLSTAAGSDSTTAIPLFAYPLAADSTGKAVAVWEVVNANPSAIDTMRFSVYVAYTATSSTTTNPYGLPITDLPLGSPLNNVALSFAPEPGGGTFSSASAATGLVAPIPRFANVNNYNGRFVSINLCQTTLLYPFVTGAAGFDTGIAVANTSLDPFGTVTQTGSCKLYAYGVTVATAGNTAISSTVPGCDTLANPLPGTNCFAVVPPGQVMSVMASAVLTNFQGYVIAVCNFQYAHGYAAVTDLGLRNLWSSYLALELTPGGVGSPRAGIAGIENLVH